MPVRTALVVEPDPAFAAKLVPLLDQMGMKSDVVVGGDAACTRLTNQRYDLVVTELSLTGVDGFQVLETLRKKATREQTRVVVVSALLALRTAASQKKQALGIDAVIAKNGPIEAALRTLRKAFPETGPAPAAAVVDAELDVIMGLNDAVAIDDGVIDLDEEARVEAVEEAKAAVAGDQPLLNAMAAEVARDFGVGTALVSFMGRDRQEYKAWSGLGAAFAAAGGTARSQTFCQHVVEADAPSTLVVPDAAVHPVFMKYAAVVDGSVRSYAGAPLLGAGGEVLGTLCLFDGRPSRLKHEDMQRLMSAARRVAGVIELERAAAHNKALVAALQTRIGVADKEREQVATTVSQLSAILEHVDAGVLVLAGPRRAVAFANAIAAELLDAPSLLGTERAILLAEIGSKSDDVDAFEDAVAADDDGAFVQRAVVRLVRPTPRVLRWNEKPVTVDGVTAQVVTLTDISHEMELLALRREAAIAKALSN